MDAKERIFKKVNVSTQQKITGINLTVNGTRYRVYNADPNMYLNEFLRCQLHLKGMSYR